MFLWPSPFLGKAFHYGGVFLKLFQFMGWVCVDLFRYFRNGRQRSAPYGVWLYVGLPGKGKTISMVEKLERLRKEFPNIKIGTNFYWKGQDFEVTSWRQLVEMDNGLDGIVFAIDEIQKTFNSRAWKDFPVDVMDTLFFLRKKPKLFLCSAQSFDRVDKVFRELTNYVIRCNTLLGRWTFNRAFRTEEYELMRKTYGNERKVITSWRYSFIQSDWLRSRFDTHLRVGALVDDALKGELKSLEDLRALQGGDQIIINMEGAPRRR